MYRPRQYAVDDPASLHKAMRSNPFATIAYGAPAKIEFAYAPVVVDGAGAFGGARFHLARANPVAECSGMILHFSFLGAHTYVSPDWYRSAGMVPTWNYIAIEGRGRARRLDEEELGALLVDLSAQEEARLAPKAPWTTNKVPAERRAALMRAIVGFSVVFDHLAGKFKLSQEKSQADAHGVISALEARGEIALASAMRASRDG